MPYYLVRYMLSTDNAYVYPKSLEGVIWDFTIYHMSKQEMLGKTETVLKADGKKVVALNSAKATKLIKEFQAGSPASDGILLRPPHKR